MPIHPDNDKLYPGGSIRSKEWKEIRDKVLRRAAVNDHWYVWERCECTGECGLSHEGTLCDGEPHPGRCEAINDAPHPLTDSTVVLTVAHLDQDPTNNDLSNLRAMCQRCHNRMDAPYRRIHAAERKRARIRPLF